MEDKDFITKKEDELMGIKMQESFAIICNVFCRYYKLNKDEYMSMCLSNTFNIVWTINK